jgi:hypothetical protein
MKPLQINTDIQNYDDYGHDLSPPLSPPPAHIIYFPETYRYAGNNLNNNDNNSNEKKHKVIPYYAIISRRKIFNIAKTLIKFIFKNNNLLLIINIVNKLWKQRIQFIQPTVFVLKQAMFIIQHNSCQQCIKYFIHFLNYHFNKVFTNKRQVHIMTTKKSSKNPFTNIILLSATIIHLLAGFTKIGSKWIQSFIKSMGGLDSIVLAICTIAFTKSLQSDRIF